MKRKKTFIIGAGASFEFGLPTGNDLVKLIENYCNISADAFGVWRSGDELMLRAFGSLKRPDGQRWNPNFLADVALKVRQNMGLAPSIDNFLDSKRGEEGWAEVGKIAIACSILNSERRSKLFFDTSHFGSLMNFANLPRNWLSELFRTMVQHKDLEAFKDALGSCNFITFNYDRVIEHFFHQAIKSYFDISDDLVDKICEDCLNVFHVYGDLGKVNCRNAGAFGKNDSSEYLLSAANRILTFTEGAKDVRQIQVAKSHIANADLILFVGFGFLPINIKLLSPSSGQFYRKKRVIGTSKGMSRENLEIASSIILQKWYGNLQYSLEFEDIGGYDLISKNSLYLCEFDLD